MKVNKLYLTEDLTQQQIEELANIISKNSDPHISDEEALDKAKEYANSSDTFDSIKDNVLKDYPDNSATNDTNQTSSDAEDSDDGKLTKTQDEIDAENRASQSNYEQKTLDKIAKADEYKAEVVRYLRENLKFTNASKFIEDSFTPNFVRSWVLSFKPENLVVENKFLQLLNKGGVIHSISDISKPNVFSKLYNVYTSNQKDTEFINSLLDDDSIIYKSHVVSKCAEDDIEDFITADNKAKKEKNEELRKQLIIAADSNNTSVLNDVKNSRVDRVVSDLTDKAGKLDANKQLDIIVSLIQKGNLSIQNVQRALDAANNNK